MKIKIDLECQTCGKIIQDVTDDESIKTGDVLTWKNQCHKSWQVTHTRKLKTEFGDAGFMSHPMITSTEIYLKKLFQLQWEKGKKSQSKKMAGGEDKKW